MLLELEGYTVRNADTLGHAKHLYDEQYPSIILLDYLMPDGPPNDFVQHVRATQDTPIVLLTATSNSDALAASLGIPIIVKKPFEIETLLNTISQCLEYAEESTSKPLTLQFS